MKNHLIYTVLLAIAVVGALLAMNKLPVITIGDYTLRTVDILADIRKVPKVRPDSLPVIEIKELDELVSPSDSVLSDSIDTTAPSEEEIEKNTEEKQPSSQRIYPNTEWINEDTNEKGVTCIVDYSDQDDYGMQPFYRALSNIDKGGYARIAVFGDSFIEGDILTADLRSYLQTAFGGSGVGFVPITSETSGFRPTVIHTFSGWDSHSVTDKKGFNYNKQGIAGHYFVPVGESAFVELRGQKKYGSHLDTCQVASVLFKSFHPLSLTAKLNNQESIPFNIEGSSELQSVRVDGNVGRIRWTTAVDSAVVFYGTTMDGNDGVVLDNFSLRGSSGYSLMSIPTNNLVEFNALRPYDLIIIQYGLNVVAEGVYDYNYYRIQMNKVINYLKQSFPNTGFLILSVGDRDYKTEEGTYETMPEIKYFLQIQRQIAKDNKIAFWNMFEAMGGEGSMYDLVHDKPSKANFDYTHINFRGGRFIAKKLFEAIKDGKTNYEKGEIYAGE